MAGDIHGNDNMKIMSGVVHGNGKWWPSREEKLPRNLRAPPLTLGFVFFNPIFGHT